MHQLIRVTRHKHHEVYRHLPLKTLDSYFEILHITSEFRSMLFPAPFLSVPFRVHRLTKSRFLTTWFLSCIIYAATLYNLYTLYFYFVTAEGMHAPNLYSFVCSGVVLTRQPAEGITFSSREASQLGHRPRHSVLVIHIELYPTLQLLIYLTRLLSAVYMYPRVGEKKKKKGRRVPSR